MKKILLIIPFIVILTGCLAKQNNTSVEPQKLTDASQSRYNEMKPQDYHKEMKSENLELADIAWHAYRTYGWNCSEITNLGENISTNGEELRVPSLISEIKGYYQIATCSSGEKLRVYPRKDTYPIITNINGGFE